MIKVTSLNKYYNKGKSNQIHVINNTSLTLPDKGFITFLGQSGSGKTTLLNTIGGLDKASGKIQYGDTTINNYNVKKIDKYRSEYIGYVFQTYNLLKSLSVEENIKVSLELIGITDQDEIDKRINFSLEAVNMIKFKRRTAGALSGGQQQRVSIARALAKNAKIIIADEPTGNLDSENGIEVMNILKSLSKDRLVLLVTHDDSFATFYSDRIIEISDGQVIQDNNNNSMTSSIDTKSEREIYLGDMEKSTEILGEYNVQYYKDSLVEVPSLNLKFIYNKGNLYLDSNLPVKLVGKSEDVVLLDSKYKKYDFEKASTFDFDMSSFTREKKSSVNFKLFFQNLKTAFLDFFRIKKGRKFLNFCLVLLGIIQGIMIISYGFTSNYDESSILYSKNSYSIEQELEGKNYNIEDTKLSSEALDILNPVYSNLYLQTEGLTATFDNETDSISLTSYFLPVSNLENKDLLAGSYPTLDYEIIMDKSLIKTISKNVNYSPEAFIGKRLTVSNRSFFISGISDNSSTAFYVTQNVMPYVNSINNSYYYNDENVQIEFNNDIYNTVIGTGFTEDNSTEKQILINIAYFNSISTVRIPYNQNYFLYDFLGNMILHSYEGETVSYKIVGFFTSTVQSSFITNDQVEDSYSYNLTSIYTSNKNSLFYKNINISDGTSPKTDSEIVVSKNSSYKIGDKIKIYTGYDNVTYVDTYKEMKVVGKSDTLISNAGYTTSGGRISLNGNKLDSDMIIFAESKENINKALEEYNLTVNESELVSKDKALASHKKSTNLFFIVTIVTLTVTVVFTYLVMRSRMFSKIYDIGVYRALGANKKRIYGLFTYDIIVLTTFSAPSPI